MELKAVVESTGIPVAYRQFPKNKAPNLPFITYYQTGENEFAADGINYFSTREFVVELYEKNRDMEAENRVEQSLTEAEIFYTKEITYIDEERCYMIIYEMEV